MKAKKTIAIADDHSLFRDGIKAMLKEFPEIHVMFEANSTNDLLQQLKGKQPQVILLDISFGEGQTGSDVIETIHQRYPDIKILILSQYYDDQTIYHVMEKGASGCLPKTLDIEVLVDAVYSASERGYYFTEKVSQAMAKGATMRKKVKLPFNQPTLTDREIQVIRLICKEKRIKEIADHLCISPRTVDSYIEKIYEKTGVKKREGIVFYAMQHGLL